LSLKMHPNQALYAECRFDPTPWLRFPAVVLFGADTYWDPRLAGGSWVYWDKTEGKDPGDFARFEFIWLSQPGPPQYFPWQHRGGMRRGEMNWVHLPTKRHPAEKPVELLTFLVKQTTAPIVIDPFMGSGTTLAACVRLGRPCIGVELDPGYFEKACDRLQKE